MPACHGGREWQLLTAEPDFHCLSAPCTDASRGQPCSVILLTPPVATSFPNSLAQRSIGTEQLLQDFWRWVNSLGSVPLVRAGDLWGQMLLAHESCLPPGLEIVPTSPKPQPFCRGCVLCPHDRLLTQPLVFASTS